MYLLARVGQLECYQSKEHQKQKRDHRGAPKRSNMFIGLVNLNFGSFKLCYVADLDFNLPTSRSVPTSFFSFMPVVLLPHQILREEGQRRVWEVRLQQR